MLTLIAGIYEPHCTSANISDNVVPSALASFSAWTMEGVLSALSTAPM